MGESEHLYPYARGLICLAMVILLKFWFTTTADEDKFRENSAFISQMVAQVSTCRQERYVQAKSPSDADIILYFEPNYLKDRNYARLLLKDPIISAYPNRCFVVDYYDDPIGFMPGVYAGMPRSTFDSSRFRAGCYIGQYNEVTTKFAAERGQSPKLLFSFRGSASHSVRNCLFTSGISSDNGVITQTYPWFTHTESEKESYVEEILNSKFVLCPRGQSTTSIRLFETMELGRVPVILSDEWVPPDGPSWPIFSLRVAESRVKELPNLLHDFEPYAAEMGKQARLAWEQWFSPEVRVVRILGYVEDIMRQRPLQHDEGVFQRQWLSMSFAWKNGWTPVQSLHRNMVQRTLINKIKSKVVKRPYPKKEL